MGVQQALQRYVHAQVLAGRRGPKLAADVKSQGKRAFARLERGLDYAPAPRSSGRPASTHSRLPPT
jgi:hypothetical protein